MKLTKTAVAALELPAGKADMIMFDDEITGFGYRLRRGAGDQVRRSWIAQYRRAGATRRLLLGSAAVLGADQARSAAREALAKVALGQDPQSDRRGRRDKDKQTLRGVIAEYLAGKKVRPRTMIEVKRYLTDARYFGPMLTMPIDAVSRRDIAARLIIIAREHGTIAGSRARGALGAFFTWSMQEGLAESNPVIGTRRPAADTPRDRVLSDPELVAVWGACEDDAFGKIVRLLVLTACRRGEIGGLRWSEVDMASGELTIAAARSKNGRAHTLPLPAMALDIITSVPHLVGRDQLFGDRSPAGFSDWARAKARLDTRSGVVNWTIHDLRRTTATRLADLAVQPHVIEQVLNHARPGVAGTYNRSPYAKEVTVALALWADRVRSLVEGAERRVLPFSAS
jgi:integrase